MQRLVLFFLVLCTPVLTILPWAVRPPLIAYSPPWEPVWNMSLSTAFMPCDANAPGPVPFDPLVTAKWGLTDTDWSNGRSWYAKQSPMNCQETMVAQAEANKKSNPFSKQFVYRNAIKSLPWFTQVREKLQDPAYWGWFLPYANCTKYQCGPNATQNLYHDFLETPHGDCGEGVECGEYLFDLRNESLRAWLRTDYLMGPLGLGNPAIKGFYVRAAAFRAFCIAPLITQEKVLLPESALFLLPENALFLSPENVLLPHPPLVFLAFCFAFTPHPPLIILPLYTQCHSLMMGGIPKGPLRRTPTPLKSVVSPPAMCRTSLQPTSRVTTRKSMLPLLREASFSPSWPPPLHPMPPLHMLPAPPSSAPIAALGVLHRKGASSSSSPATATLHPGHCPSLSRISQTSFLFGEISVTWGMRGPAVGTAARIHDHLA
jgi:hypothetical protein